MAKTANVSPKWQWPFVSSGNTGEQNKDIEYNMEKAAEKPDEH